MKEEVVGQSPISTTVKALYIHWFRVFRKDDRVAQFAHHSFPRGREDAQNRSVKQILLLSNLDDLGVREDGSIEMIEKCRAIVDVLFEVSPKALAAWVEDHDEPIEFLADHNDIRIITISKLAQQKFEEAKT